MIVMKMSLVAYLASLTCLLASMQASGAMAGPSTLPDAGSATRPTKAPASRPESQQADLPRVIYNGKERTANWLDAAFRKYGPVILTGDGKSFVDTGYMRQPEACLLLAGQTLPTTIESDPPAIGDFGVAYATVLQVLTPDEVLATVHEELTNKVILIHIEGIDAKLTTDGSSVSTQTFMYLGPYSYKNAEGIKVTIQSWRVCRPVTKDEFAVALSRGLILMDRKRVKVTPNWGQKDWQKNLIGYGYTWFKIVETKVP
jgi:hypothetical protein